MGKINLLTSELVRVGTGAREVSFTLDFNAKDAVSGNATLSFIAATKEDFSDANTNVIKGSFSHKPDAASDWTSVTGNTISSNMMKNIFKVDLEALATNTVQYLKVVVTISGKKFQSRPVMYTARQEIDFKLATPISVGFVKPNKVRILDKLTSIGSGAFTIKVEVTNNALDTTPVWENATDAYLNNDYYEFTNTTKTEANPWSISVKYYIKKANVTDVIELSDVFVAFV
jgi:hypothetical protein